MDSPHPLGDIGLRMTHFVLEEASPGEAQVSVVADVDVSDLDFEPQDGEHVAALQLVLAAIDRSSGEHSRYDQSVELRLDDRLRAKLEQTWLPVVRDFELRTA